MRDVKPTGGKRAKVTLTREDDFDSRCAGKLTLKALGANVRKKAKFDFGWHSPEAGGPSEVVANVGSTGACGSRSSAGEGSER